MAYLADGIPHHPCPHQVDENVLGFAEMMTIKLGEMMDQPRHVRTAAELPPHPPHPTLTPSHPTPAHTAAKLLQHKRRRWHAVLTLCRSRAVSSTPIRARDVPF